MKRLAAVSASLFVSIVAFAAQPISIVPETIELASIYDQVQMLVTDDQDLTRKTKFSIADTSVATIDNNGRIRAHGQGKTVLKLTITNETRELPITVGADIASIDFERDIRPILNKAGCASGACHAAQHGKGGFKLSVFGFDPTADFAAIAHAGRQRRVNFARPEASLILRKPTGDVTHGGGKLLVHDSVDYERLHDWVATGAPAPDSKIADLTDLEIMPNYVVGSKLTQQLRVVAHFADETSRDVTALAKYDSLDQGVVDVNDRGLAQVFGRGQTAIMIRYEGAAKTAMFVAPYSNKIELKGWKDNNIVDELAVKKFKQLGLEPSELCDDATFVRRAYLDAIGTLPTIEETRAFTDSKEPDRREKLIDRLLGLTGDPALDTYNDLYAAYWTLKWSDLIRNSSKTVGAQGMWSMHNWMKEKFRTNETFDAFVRELVTAKGSIYSNGPANFFRIHNNSSALAEATSQLFMGVRLECAKCHHHPFEKFSQADYYGLAAFFARVTSKSSEDFGLFGRETVVMVRATGDVNHPRTRKRLQPTPLGGEPVDHELDRRIPFADWLTSKDNEYFAQSVVNRYVAYLLGTGLVDPIDDMRMTNPPSNQALMDALANRFTDSGFDLKQLIRTIMNSRLYQLSSVPTEQNLSDRRFYSYYQAKRLPAEPLLDAIDQATGTPTKFKSLPLGTRAIELPDAEYPNYFLTTFAKPKRASVCECERSTDANLAQALHTANGDILVKKIADKKGRVAKCLADKKSHQEIVSELYLATLSRTPTEQELAKSKEFLDASPSPKECYEDLLWALVNSKQFLHIH